MSKAKVKTKSKAKAKAKVKSKSKVKAKAKTKKRKIYNLKPGERYPNQTLLEKWMKDNQDRFFKALEECHGNLTKACKQVKLSRNTVYNWLKQHPELKDRVADAREKTIDYVEDQLFDLIKKKDKTAIIFFLKCKAKDRGYVERQEVATQQHITLNIQNVGETAFDIDALIE